jgi:hypothetical protein
VPGIKTISTGDRGASVAVNHVLALGITAILISGLLLSAATLLRDQRANNAEPELRTIGNRIAGQITEGERMIGDSGDTVTFYIDQPARIAGSPYEVSLLDLSAPGNSGACGNYAPPTPTSDDYCILVESGTVGEVPVPLSVDLSRNQIDISSTAGGEYEIKVCGDPADCP